MNRKNLIDGVPNSYDTNYIIKTQKVCEICLQQFEEIQIENNEIVCAESFDFYHKVCLEKQKISYVHFNPKDKSTPVILNSKYDTRN